VECATRLSRGLLHSYCRLPLVSLWLITNCPIDQAGHCLVSVLRDQSYLAVSPAEQVAALAAFRLPPQAVGSTLAPSVVVTDDMRIALCNDIISK
jgi:hypothetical protein